MAKSFGIERSEELSLSTDSCVELSSDCCKMILVSMGKSSNAAVGAIANDDGGCCASFA